jgi:quinol monooxygenase YgiN
MKKLFAGISVLIILASCNTKNKEVSSSLCGYNKDSMIVVMRMERKVKPENVTLFKNSFDKCRAEVLAKEPGCLDYSLYQSYHDSTMFLLTEAWRTKGDHNAHMQLEHTKTHLAEIKGINDPSFKPTANYTYWVCPGANGAAGGM